MKNISKQLDDLAPETLAFDSLDQVYDSLRLVGAVFGLKALVEILLTSDDPALKLQAARKLTDLKEDPEDIVARLRRSRVGTMSMEELEEAFKSKHTPAKTLKLIRGDTDG